MPYLTGVDLLVRVRAVDKVIPLFVLMTGHSDATEKDGARLGATAMLHKPFRIKHLEECLRENG